MPHWSQKNCFSPCSGCCRSICLRIFWLNGDLKSQCGHCLCFSNSCWDNLWICNFFDEGVENAQNSHIYSVTSVVGWYKSLCCSRVFREDSSFPHRSQTWVMVLSFSLCLCWAMWNFNDPSNMNPLSHKLQKCFLGPCSGCLVSIWYLIDFKSFVL